MQTIHTGIIGFGLSGRVFHAPFIHILEGFELSKISTGNSESINLIHKIYPQTTVVSSADEILNDAKIDLVIVASPNEYHYEQAKMALLAGKHVLVEKPFTETVAQADELISIAKEKNLILAPYQNRRFISDYKTVKKILEQKLLGEIVNYEAYFDRYRPIPRKDGLWKEKASPASGMVYDLGSHIIDQALSFFGMPQAVTAQIDIQREWCPTIDHYDIKLHYPTFTATLGTSMLAKIPRPTFLLHGTNGAFEKYGVDVQEDTLNKGTIPQGEDWGKEPEEIWGNIDTVFNGKFIQGKYQSEQGDYRDFFINLRDTILGKSALIVRPEDARNIIHIIELAYQSNKEKRTIKVN